MADSSRCVRCKSKPGAGQCCSNHNALLCHYCYRATHFVEVCVEECEQCSTEGIPAVLGPPVRQLLAALDGQAVGEMPRDAALFAIRWLRANPEQADILLGYDRSDA